LGKRTEFVGLGSALSSERIGAHKCTSRRQAYGRQAPIATNSCICPFVQIRVYSWVKSPESVATKEHKDYKEALSCRSLLARAAAAGLARSTGSGPRACRWAGDSSSEIASKLAPTIA
jgi:hypothetical protein